MSLSVGHPNDGWQVRAKRLRNTDSLRVRSKSNKLSYGHPALVLMLKRTAKDIASAEPGSVMLVGDLSREGGGALAGHRSHQSGRDADVGFDVTDKNGKAKLSTEFHAFREDGTAKDGSGLLFDDWRNWLLVKSWILDKRAGISHIFVHTSLRRRLLSYAAKNPRAKRYVTEAAGLLKQPEGVSPHDDHFHVRIACPKRHQGLCFNESK
jgi:penicillin-insensitive murein endopeptidase